MKNRKHATFTPATGAPALSIPRPFTLDPLVDNVARFLGQSGFRQVVLPPLDEIRHFPEWVGEPLHVRPGRGATMRGEWALWPTHVLNVKKLYRKHREGLPPAVAKWFYVLPVVQHGDDGVAVKHELGIFVLGEQSSLAYAQLINSVVEMFSGLGLPDATIEIGSRGCQFCQRAYAEALTGETGESGRLCERCLKNLPHDLAAVWNCRESSCQSLLSGMSSQMIDFLDESCRSLLMDTLETIDGLEIAYVLNPFLSGHISPDRIVFDLTLAASGGAAGRRPVVGRGGSYSGLHEAEPRTDEMPVIGFLTDLETVAAAMPEDKAVMQRPTEAFVISLGTAAGVRALQLFRLLQRAGISVADGFLGNQGIKNQLKAAADAKSEIALIIGQKEAMDETVILRDIRSGMQEVFMMDRIIEEVEKRLGK